MPHPRDGKNQLDFQMYSFMLNLLKIDLLKNMKYSRSLLDPENYKCGHEQPHNFFSAFVDFQTFPDNSGKPKSVNSKQKN